MLICPKLEDPMEHTDINSSVSLEMQIQKSIMVSAKTKSLGTLQYINPYLKL